GEACLALVAGRAPPTSFAVAQKPAAGGRPAYGGLPSLAPMSTAADAVTPARVIDNPISGERIVIRESGEETGGRRLSFDLYLPRGGHVPARHVHPLQEER